MSVKISLFIEQGSIISHAQLLQETLTPQRMPRVMALLKIIIHRMQIWRTTRSPPGTSCMKARLVRPLCFAFAMLPQKSLASSSIWSVSFRPGCEFCVSECHQKGVKSSTEEKVFSFSLPVHL